MKTVSAGLANHLGQDTTTTAMLWKLKRQDGVIIGFTDHDEPVTFNDGTEGSPVGSLAVTYLPYDGATATATESGSDMSTSSQELVGYLDDSRITEADIFANVYDYAHIEIRLVNWANLSQGALLWKKGTLGEIKTKNGQFTAEIRGLEFYLNTNIGETYGAICRADLGDSRCTFNIAAASQEGVVVSASDMRTFVAAQYPLGSPAVPLKQAINGSTAAAPDSWFNEGVLTWLTGRNAGYKIEVGSQMGTTIVLFENMPYPVQAGDTFSIEPGCQHDINTCHAKYNNADNFRGEPHIPGNAQIMVYPNADGTVPST